MMEITVRKLQTLGLGQRRFWRALYVVTESNYETR